jgi:hypothetical protein
MEFNWSKSTSKAICAFEITNKAIIAGPPTVFVEKELI